MYRTLHIVTENKQFDRQVRSGAEMDGLCGELTEEILKHYQSEIVEHLIKNEYFYFSSPERTFIKEDTEKILKSSDQTQIIAYIHEQLKNCLADSDFLNMNGFLSFRLAHYIEYLKMTIDEAIMHYLCKLESDELIDYLKNHVAAQQPFIETVHMVIQDNHYSIFSGQLEEIMVIHHYDDLLLNTLVTIAPLKLFIYGEIPNENLRQTIHAIFGERILYKECFQKIQGTEV